jgi:hypothetical protein
MERSQRKARGFPVNKPSIDKETRGVLVQRQIGEDRVVFLQAGQ